MLNIGEVLNLLIEVLMITWKLENDVLENPGRRDVHLLHKYTETLELKHVIIRVNCCAFWVLAKDFKQVFFFILGSSVATKYCLHLV